MEPELIVDIINVEPTAGYEGVVYERTIEVRLSNGQRIQLFDGVISVIDQSMETSTMNIVVLANPRSNGVERSTRQTNAIEQPEEPISDWSHVFYGSILQKEIEDTWFREPQDFLLLDVGIGSILLEVSSQLRESISEGNLKRGESLRVETSRTEIIDVDEAGAI